MNFCLFACWVILHAFLKSVDFFFFFFFFFKLTFTKKSFRNTIRVSNNLDPDQARHFTGPDLGPNCLQRLSADDKVATSGDRVNIASDRRRYPENIFLIASLKHIML